MSDINEDDAVGHYMQATLINNTKVEGTIFTYNPKERLLVLMQNAGKESTVKMICPAYIKEYKLTKSQTAEQKLPAQLDSFSRLPSMQVGRDKSIFKQASVALKQAEARRMEKMEHMDPSTPIAACDALVKIARLYPDISWENDSQVIRITEDVVVIGEPDWSTPKAILVEGAPEKEKQLVDRIQSALASRSK